MIPCDWRAADGSQHGHAPARGEDTERLTVAPIVGPDDPRRFTDSGIEIAELYTEADLPEELDLGEPGEFPYTRGVHREMYRKQTWTMRQYAGYASAKESNERYRYLLSKGSTGLSMAFDLPTQLGLDSDNPRCLGEVGRTGVAIDTIDDMRTAFDGIPLDQVSTSMTINAPAACLLLLYELVGEEQGVPSEKLRGTTQNDVLKEYIARGNYIYPPEPTMRLTTDLFQYCQRARARAGTRSRSPATTSARRAARPCRRSPSRSARASPTSRPRSTRACRWTTSRRAWRSSSTATTTSSRRSPSSARPGACGRTSCASASAPTNPKATMLRFHTQTGGVTLTAQQPENNIVRVALQGFAAVCGGTQSLHTNGFDEALALPTERAAKIALRTQQILAHESGAADTVDPFAGSYFVESLTDEIEARAHELIEKVDALGGSVNAIEFITGEIDESAWGYQERYRIGQDIVVGVNEYQEDDIEVPDLLRVDPESEREQVERLKRVQGQPRPGARRAAPGGAARGRPRHREPAARDPPGAEGPLLAGRGVRRDAGRLRQVRAHVLSRPAAIAAPRWSDVRTSAGLGHQGAAHAHDPSRRLLRRRPGRAHHGGRRRLRRDVRLPDHVRRRRQARSAQPAGAAPRRVHDRATADEPWPSDRRGRRASTWRATGTTGASSSCSGDSAASS